MKERGKEQLSVYVAIDVCVLNVNSPDIIYQLWSFPATIRTEN